MVLTQLRFDPEGKALEDKSLQDDAERLAEIDREQFGDVDLLGEAPDPDAGLDFMHSESDFDSGFEYDFDPGSGLG